MILKDSISYQDTIDRANTICFQQTLSLNITYNLISRMEDREKVIYECIKNSTDITIMELKKKLGYSYNSLRNYLNRLIDDKKIKCKNKYVTTYYRALDKETLKQTKKEIIIEKKTYYAI